MGTTSMVISKEQAEIVEVLAVLYQEYETSPVKSLVKTLIWSNLEQLKKQVKLDSEQAAET